MKLSWITSFLYDYPFVPCSGNSYENKPWAVPLERFHLFRPGDWWWWLKSPASHNVNIHNFILKFTKKAENLQTRNKFSNHHHQSVGFREAFQREQLVAYLRTSSRYMAWRVLGFSRSNRKGVGRHVEENRSIKVPSTAFKLAKTFP